MQKVTIKGPTFKVPKQPKNSEIYLDTVHPVDSDLYGQDFPSATPYLPYPEVKKNKIVSETTMPQSTQYKDDYSYGSFSELEDDNFRIPTPHFNPNKEHSTNQQFQKNIKISNLEEEVIRASHRRFSKMPKYNYSNASSDDYSATIIVKNRGTDTFNR